DTGVGKTWISQGLMRCLASSGKSVVGMKPVASGCLRTDQGLRNDDALLLQQAATISVAYELINPYSFEPAIAPEAAADLAGVTIDPRHIFDCYEELNSIADSVVVEGVGGWRVPLAGDYDVAMMARQLALPVVLVVNIRLGCINHARLTAESIRGSGMHLLGWVANHLNPAETNSYVVGMIDRALAAPCIGVVPLLPSSHLVSDYLVFP
ncbi:MAG: dethiobiotin synthase, partial [Gammaproteobacteria bacterium]